MFNPRYRTRQDRSWEELKGIHSRMVRTDKNQIRYRYLDPIARVYLGHDFWSLLSNGWKPYLPKIDLRRSRSDTHWLKSWFGSRTRAFTARSIAIVWTPAMPLVKPRNPKERKQEPTFSRAKLAYYLYGKRPILRDHTSPAGMEWKWQSGTSDIDMIPSVTLNGLVWVLKS